MEEDADLVDGLALGLGNAEEGEEPEHCEENRKDGERVATDHVLQRRVGDPHDEVSRPVDQSGDTDRRGPGRLVEDLGGDEPRDGAGPALEEDDEEHDGHHRCHCSHLVRLRHLKGDGQHHRARRHPAQTDEVEGAPPDALH